MSTEQYIPNLESLNPLVLLSHQRELTENLIKKLEKEIPNQFYKAFFSQVQIAFTGEKLIILAEDQKILNHIKSRYGTVIKKKASELWGKTIIPQYQLKVNESNLEQDIFHSPIKKEEELENQLPLFTNSDSNKQNSKSKKNKVEHQKNDVFKTQYDSQIYLNPDYTFERFIVGTGNEHAFIAAKGVAMHPNKLNNPLYIYGSVGLGKTHLLMAIGNYIQKNSPWLRFLYSSAEIFQADIAEAAQSKNFSNFRSKYRAIDVLLFDDIQLVAGKDFTQEEIFNTFNILYQSGKQIIISSDRPAQKLSTLKDRLISRFQSGLIIDIKPPTLSNRIDILKFKASEMNLQLDDTIYSYIAAQFKNQVRHLEACLIKLNFIISVHQKSLDLDDVKLALADINDRATTNVITMDIILEHISKAFQITDSQIKSKTRAPDVVLARHISMYLIKNLIPNLSLAEIAMYFNRTDHSTINHAEKKVKKIIIDNKEIAYQIEQIIDTLKK